MIKFVIIFLILSSNVFANDGDYYFNIGHQNQENLDKAIINFNKALELYKEENKIKGVADCYYYLGYIAELKDKNREAIRSYLKSIEYSKKVKEYNLTLKSMSNLISIYLDYNLYSESELIFNDALKICNEEIVEDNLKYRTFYNYANLKYQIKDFRQSINFLDSINTIELASSFKKKIYNLYGLIYQSVDKLDKAKEFYLKSLEEVPNNKVSLINLVRFFNYYGPRDSLNKYVNLYQSFTSEQDNNDFVDSLIFAELYYYQGKFNKSISMSYKVLDYFNSSNNLGRSIEAYNLILKNQVALENFANYDQILDSIDYLNDKLLQANLASTSDIIKDLDNITFENQLLQKEYEETRNYLILSVFILIIFIGLTYTSIRFYHLRQDNFRLILDMVIHINTINTTIKNRFRNVLSRNQKTLITQYDLDDDEELFRNHEEVVKVMLDIEDIVSKSSKELKENKKSKKIVEEIISN